MAESPFQNKEYIETRLKEVFGEAAPRFKSVFTILFAFIVASFASGLIMFGIKYTMADLDLRPFLSVKDYISTGFFINFMALIVGFPFTFIIKATNLDASEKQKRFFKILARIINGGFFGAMILMPIGLFGGALGGYIFAILTPPKKEANGI